MADTLEGAGALKQRFQRHAGFETSQVGAEAVVNAETEREMTVVLAADVEALGLIEDRLVTVGRAEPADDETAGLELDAADLDLAGQPAWIHLDRRRVPQYLFDCRSRELGVGAQTRKLV